MSDGLDFCKTLIEWRNKQHQSMLEEFPHTKPATNLVNFFHQFITNKKKIIITVGDSWTWGGGLDTDLRLQQVYGAILQQHLDCDWINIGCPGFSNSYILEHLSFLERKLKSTCYEKIIFVITLTENLRDIQTFPSFTYDYQSLYNKLGLCQEFYDTILADIEKFWIKQVIDFTAEMDPRVQIIIGKNFVWHSLLAEKLHNKVNLLNLNWIECLAGAQNLDRPKRTNLVCSWIFYNIDSVHSLLNIKDKTEFKKWSLPYIDSACEVNAWLDASPMNYKKASKHPNANGHRVWADYIRQNLQ